MAIRTKYAYCDISAIIARMPGEQSGAGMTDKLAAGMDTSVDRRYRTLVRPTFPEGFWNDVRLMRRWTIEVRAAPWQRVNTGSSPLSRFRRIVEDWDEGGSDHLTLNNQGGVVWPGPANEAADQASGTGWIMPNGGAYTVDMWVRVANDQMTSLCKWWAPVGIPALNAGQYPSGVATDAGRSSTKANYGLAIAQNGDDWTTNPQYPGVSNNAEFFSDDVSNGAYRVRFVLEYDDNRPPRPPIDLRPRDDELTLGAWAFLSGTLDDDDLPEGASPGPSTDYISKSQQQVRRVGTTAVISDVTYDHARYGTGTRRFSILHQLASSTLGWNMEWRGRTADKSAVFKADGSDWTGWQPWSTGLPPRVVMESFAFDRDTTDPTYTGSVVPAYAGQVLGRTRIHIWRFNPDGSKTVLNGASDNDWMDTPGGTGFSVNPNESPGIQFGTEHWVLPQVGDSRGFRSPGPGESGAPVAQRWTPTLSIGPSAMSPRSAATKFDSQTPGFTIGHSEAFDQYMVEIASGPDGQGTMLWRTESGVSVGTTTSLVATYGSNDVDDMPIPWGTNPGSWRAMVRKTASGTWTEWSPWYPYAVNTIPTAPVQSLVMPDGSLLPLSTTTKRVAATLVPEVYTTYEDPDQAAYGDIPNGRETEFRIHASPIGSGALVELRSSTSDITNYESPGRRESLDSATGWTPGTAAVLSADAAIKKEGTASLKAVVTGAVSSQSTGPTLVLRGFSGAARMRIWVRANTVANIPLTSSVRVRFTQPVTGGVPYEDYYIRPTADGTWQEFDIALGSPSGSGNGSLFRHLPVRLDLIVISTASVTVNFDDLRFGNPRALGDEFDVRTRYRDNATPITWGGLSTWGWIGVSLPPVLGVGAAFASSNPRPTIDWTSDQATVDYRVLIYQQLAGGEALVHDSTWVTSAATAYVPPAKVLDSPATYRAEIHARNADGLEGVVSITWTTGFVAPAQLAGLTVATSPTTSQVDLSWTAQVGGYFDRYVIWRSTGGGPMVEIGSITSQTQGTFTDWLADLRTPLEYEVYVDTGGITNGQSPPTTIETLLDLPGEFLIAPGYPQYSFQILSEETSFGRELPKRQTIHSIIGKAGHGVTSGKTQLHRGTLHVKSPPGFLDQAKRIIEWSELKLPFLGIKTRLGDVHKVRVQTIPEDYGWLEDADLSIPFVVVEG